ncbi:flavin reductase family protein [Micromonospora sp. WMMD1082]|uniref:flavin reductase family protein n=1 Tax=Micromonospora sp. WMMD1082 TaxID=3016104 RepID=UPI0024161539|nr:flavin reductase family protein [Micromonospora sp. WMMD1082]MDG4795564.1 flavin reductase family protein [Micromonospora sp. WMMD1082]
MISLETAVDERTFRAAMSRLGKCVAITTALGPAGPVGCTTTSLMSLSVAPPSVLLAFRTGGRTLADLLAAGRFAVNVLSRDQNELVHRFAAGNARDRFSAVAYRLHHGVPLLRGVAVTMVCQLRESLTAVDHTLVVGTVCELRTGPDEPLVLVGGRPHRAVPETPAPLLPAGNC